MNNKKAEPIQEEEETFPEGEEPTEAIDIENPTIEDKIKLVNELLKAGEPDNISYDSFTGYTGYKPQHIIDAMNQVFKIGGWGFEEMSVEVIHGEKNTLVVTQVNIWIVGCEFKPVGWGQSNVTRGDVGDAKKGAQTDAIKKAFSYFSIGNRAYLGLLPSKGEEEKQVHTEQIKANVTSTEVPSSTPAEETICEIHKVAMFRGVSKNKFDDEGNPKKYWWHKNAGNMCFGS